MAQPSQSRGTVSFETCSSLVIPGRIPFSLSVAHTGAGPGVTPGGAALGGAGHLLAVYPCAAEPAIVFCCLLSDGKQVPAIQTGSPNPPAFVPPGQPGCGFALEPKYPFKGFLSPSTCLGFNSVLAHLSWVIKHERAEPRDLPCCALQGGEGEASGTPQVGLGAREAVSPQEDVSLLSLLSLLPGHSGSVGRAGAAAASSCPRSAPGCLERGSRAS